MQFEWRLSLDTLLLALSMLTGAAAVWGTLRSDLKKVMSDVAALKAANEAQTRVLIEMARQDQQLKDHDRRLNKLEAIS